MPLVLLALCAGGEWGLVRGGPACPPAGVGRRALGLVLAIWLANLLGRWIDPSFFSWRSQWRRRPGLAAGRSEGRRRSRSYVIAGVVRPLSSFR
jgi:hypothetical protein